MMRWWLTSQMLQETKIPSYEDTMMQEGVGVNRVLMNLARFGAHGFAAVRMWSETRKEGSFNCDFLHWGVWVSPDWDQNTALTHGDPNLMIIIIFEIGGDSQDE